jgi:hypothetical protein
MSRRVVEALSGVGEIYAGGVLLRSTPYRLSVFQEADGGELKIDGHIDITGIGEAVVLAGAPILTLRLTDGRQLQFRLTDTGGAILGTSEIQST